MTRQRALQQWLVDTGAVTETGLTRTPQHRTCRGCGQRTLAAIDDIGSDAITWGWPTTALGELLAVTQRRHTWHVSAYGGLRFRIAPTIAAKPAGVVDVHVEHRCADQPPPYAATCRPQPPSLTAHGRPPF